jgi:superfamily II DNA or RNA helicase
MKDNFFQKVTPNIVGNVKLRSPQIEGCEAIANHYASPEAEREVAVVLPVGCGKSGLMTLAPFMVKSKRVLLIAPGTRIAGQLHGKDFNPNHDEFFYRKCDVIAEAIFPETAEIRGSASNLGDLEAADVVVTNIQQLQGSDNKWLSVLPADFFDLILFDEGHHNVAQSWQELRERFPNAKIINLSATPTRADGQVMEGRVIYSFPVARAIAEGYVKRLKAVVLSPASLKFVRELDGVEQEVGREEVIRLGEDDADFRRSIVSSKESLGTIVDCSIQQLRWLRRTTGCTKHKIIVSALNYRHCIQIKEAYRARELRAEYVHSREEENTDRVLNLLEADELDVIIQVRKLGEGFDHKWLSVATICSIFSNLSPFVQFVGRIMRVAVQNDPINPNNQGIVVYHAGGNIAQRWSDFKDFSEADQAYFDDLLITEEVFAPGARGTQEIDPAVPTSLITPPLFKITTQLGLELTEDDLVKLTPAQSAAYDLLVNELGPEQILRRLQFNPMQPRRQDARRAAKKALDDEIKNAASRILGARGIKNKGRELDTKHLGRDNFVVIKSMIDRKAAQLVGQTLDNRSEWSAEQIAQIREALPRLVEEISNEI